MYFFVKQLDSSDCGCACLAMVCKYYGKDFSIIKLRDILGTDIQGTPINGLYHGAEDLGFDCRKVRITKDAIHDTFTLPAICHWRTEEGASHFIVLIKVHKKNVVILNPNEGKRKISINEFFDSFDGLILLLYPKQEFYENVSEKKNVFKQFFSLLIPHKKIFVFSIIASFLITFLGLLYSLFNKTLMDEILPYKLEKELIYISIGFGLVLFFKVLMEFTRGHLVLYLSQKIDLPLMIGYFNHIFKLPQDFFASRKIGDVTTRFQDAITVKDILTKTALSLFIDIFLTLATTIILIIMSWKLFLVLLVITIFSLLLVFAYKGIYKKLNKESMEKGALLNSTIIDSLKGISTIKANADEERVLDKIDSQYTSVLKTSFKSGFHSNVQSSLSTFISSIGNLILMALGVYFAIKDDMTIGSVLQFFTIANYFIDPIGRMVNLQLQIQEADISLKRLGELFDIKEEEDNEKENRTDFKINGNVVLENISFHYGRRINSLSRVSLTIKQGQKIALVGESGSGKTTLSKLLLKFYLSQEGRILFDGNEINDLNAFALRKQIGYVPQDIELFSGTIIDNLRVAKEDATDNDISAALDLADCNEFINRLPFGKNSFIDSSGGGLSGGEKQRLAIARAIIKDPNLIIFDEATSSLDYHTEKEILKMIYQRLTNKSILIIAHRLSTIINCDKIYVLDKGEIVEQGTHKELLEHNGKYKQLWDLQQGIIIKNEDEETLDDKMNNDDCLEY